MESTFNKDHLQAASHEAPIFQKKKVKMNQDSKKYLHQQFSPGKNLSVPKIPENQVLKGEDLNGENFDFLRAQVMSLEEELKRKMENEEYLEKEKERMLEQKEAEAKRWKLLYDHTYQDASKADVELFHLSEDAKSLEKRLKQIQEANKRLTNRNYGLAFFLFLSLIATVIAIFFRNSTELVLRK